MFTTPEIGTVGLTEPDALRRYGIIDIYKTSFRPMKATLTGGGERTIMKLVVDAASDRVVGAHILGAEAGEIIQTLAIAIKMGATKRDFDATMAVHPTAAEELVTMRARTARLTWQVSSVLTSRPARNLIQSKALTRDALRDATVASTR